MHAFRISINKKEEGIGSRVRDEVCDYRSKNQFRIVLNGGIFHEENRR